MRSIPTDLPAEIVPLSWLLGTWEGTGVLDYLKAEERISCEFGQRITFSHDDCAALNYASSAWLLDQERTALSTELGFWRLSTPAHPDDSGPGMLPGNSVRPYGNTDAVETLRNAQGGFDLEVSVLHPSGISELYLGTVQDAKVTLATDAVLRPGSAQEYSAATRLYGLVESHLLWAWDIAAFGQNLRTHASARLAKIE